MVMIDMTEEPETETDLIFKATNQVDINGCSLMVPIYTDGQLVYVDDWIFEQITKMAIDKY
jgi:hypothetical protein